MNTAFSHALRVHLCPACAGTVPVPVEGGSACCDVCSLQIEFAPRDDAPLGEGARFDNTAWRDELLRQQSLSDDTPSELRALSTGGRLPVGSEADVLERWQLARAAVDATGTHRADLRFVGLTLVLSDHLTSVNDNLQLRALLETALETLTGPQHRQLVLARLARAALRVDDLPSAEDWLQHCYRHADELRADTAYRVAAAQLALRSGKAETALELLGREPGQWPLHIEEQLLAALLRVTALERRGAMASAVEQLSAVMETSPQHAAKVEASVRDSGALRLCQRTFALARERAEAEPRVRAINGDPALRRALPWGVLTVAVALAAAAANGLGFTLAGRRIDLFLLAVALLLAIPVGVILARGSGYEKAR